MHRRNDVRPRANVWVERIVWNVAAATVVAVMIVVLLGSLRWLDEFAPPADTSRAATGMRAPVEHEADREQRSTSIATRHGPNG